MSLFLLDDGRLFIHIPKCGGTSIRAGRQQEGPTLYEPNPRWSYAHSFAVIRNPYDRFESAYIDFKYNRSATKLTPLDWLLENYDLNREAPESAGHHIAPMVDPLHGIQHADRIINFEQYEFDRHLRPNPDQTIEWTEALRNKIKDLYRDDFDLYNKVCAS